MLAVYPGHLYVGPHFPVLLRKLHAIRNKSSARAKPSGPVWAQTAAHHTAQQQPSTASVENASSWPALQLQDVQVILASPKAAANIGSVARAAANFEIACGSSHMATMMVVPTLQEALAGTSASIGFTRRAGNTRLVHPSLSHLLQQFPGLLPNPEQQPVSSKPLAQEGLALVFGREESGLTETELSLCTHSCSIPTGTRQPSLNLSHAVCVILAQLYERRAGYASTASSVNVQQIPKQHRPASRKEVDALIHRWTELTREAGLKGGDSVGGTGSHGRKRRSAGHIKAVLSRAQITSQVCC